MTKDGSALGSFEGILPDHPFTFATEYAVDTQGRKTRAAASSKGLDGDFS